MLRAIEAVQTALTDVIVFLSEVFIAGWFCVSLFSLSPSNTLFLSPCLSSTTCLSGGSLVTLTSWPCITLWTWSTCSTVTVLAPGCSFPGHAGVLQTHIQHCCVARASAFQQHQTKHKTVHTHNVERERHAQRVDTWPQFVLTLNLFSKWRRENLWRCSCWPWLLWIGFFSEAIKMFYSPVYAGDSARVHTCDKNWATDAFGTQQDSDPTATWCNVLSLYVSTDGTKTVGHIPFVFLVSPWMSFTSYL